MRVFYHLSCFSCKVYSIDSVLSSISLGINYYLLFVALIWSERLIIASRAWSFACIKDSVEIFLALCTWISSKCFNKLYLFLFVVCRKLMFHRNVLINFTFCFFVVCRKLMFLYCLLNYICLFISFTMYAYNMNAFVILYFSSRILYMKVKFPLQYINPK